jgi:predicted NBD/HSP70 family sugar kinase
MAIDACERAGDALGIALISAVNLLDPGTIVLGGVFAPLFPWLSGPASRTLSRIGHAVPRLQVSAVGPDAATLGAAGQVIEQIIANPAAHLTRP